jgi:hypothetical protein
MEHFSGYSRFPEVGSTRGGVFGITLGVSVGDHDGGTWCSLGSPALWAPILDASFQQVAEKLENEVREVTTRAAAEQEAPTRGWNEEDAAALRCFMSPHCQHGHECRGCRNFWMTCCMFVWRQLSKFSNARHGQSNPLMSCQGFERRIGHPSHSRSPFTTLPNWVRKSTLTQSLHRRPQTTNQRMPAMQNKTEGPSVHV